MTPIPAGVAWLEATLLFLVVPAASFVVGLLAVWARVTELRDEQKWKPQRPSPVAVFPMFAAILVTHTIFGFILWFLDQPVIRAIDAGTTPDATLVVSLHFWASVAFGWTAAVATLTQAWTARVRWRSYAGPEFGRVQPLVVLPETCTIFALSLVFLVIGTLGDLVHGETTTTPAAVSSAVLSFQVYALSVLAAPLGMALSHRQVSLLGRGFTRALLFAEVGVMASVIGFVWAYLQILGLRA